MGRETLRIIHGVRDFLAGFVKGHDRDLQCHETYRRTLPDLGAGESGGLSQDLEEQELTGAGGCGRFLQPSRRLCIFPAPAGS